MAHQSSPGEVQVEESYYEFTKYMDEERWVSFYYQILELHRLKNISSILEIGPGIPILRDHVARHMPGVKYQALDIAEYLKPEIVGSATAIPLPDMSVDVVVAFEILEHLPFEDFPKALAEIARVSKGDVLISIPHFGPPVRFLLKLPFLPEIRFAFKIPYPRVQVFNGQHYWEVGKRGYSRKKIRNLIAQKFVIIREYVHFYNQYHRFYILKKRS